MNIIIKSLLSTLLAFGIAFGAIIYANLDEIPLVSSDKNSLFYLAERIARVKKISKDFKREEIASSQIIEDSVSTQYSAVLRADENSIPLNSEKTKPEELEELLGLNRASEQKIKNNQSQLMGDSYSHCKMLTGQVESRDFQTTQFVITLSDVDFSGSIDDVVEPFEVEFLDSIEIWKSSNSGVLKKEIYHHNSELRLARLHLNASIPVNFELHFKDEFYQFAVPNFSQTSFQKFIKENNLSNEGGYLLIGVDESLKFLNIDSKYHAGVYLDQAFKPTKSRENYYYLLFSGLKPGIHKLWLEDSKGNELDKEIFISKSEITFDFLTNGIEEANRNQLCVSFPYQKSKYSELNLSKEKLSSIRGSQIDILGTNALNIYSFNRLAGSQDKVSLLNSDNPKIEYNPIQSESIILPSKDEVDYILSSFELGDEFSGCVLQMNLNQAIKDIEFDSLDEFGAIKPEYFVMQSDGELTQDYLPQSRRMYIYSENESLISAKINYLDETQDFISQYCSEGSFIINTL